MNVTILEAKPAFNGEKDKYGNVGQWVKISASDADTGQPIEGIIKSMRGYKPGDQLDATWVIATSLKGKQYIKIQRVKPDGVIASRPEYRGDAGPQKVGRQDLPVEPRQLPTSDQILEQLARLHTRSFQFCLVELGETELPGDQCKQIAAEWAGSDARQVMIEIMRGQVRYISAVPTAAADPDDSIPF